MIAQSIHVCGISIGWDKVDLCSLGKTTHCSQNLEFALMPLQKNFKFFSTSRQM